MASGYAHDAVAWRRTLNAILRMVGASAFFAGMGACVKGSTASLPFLVAVFFRSAVGLLPLLVYFRWTHASLRATQHGLLLLRSLFGFTAVCMFFLAIERLRLSTATVLNFASPVFVVILSGIFLRERGAFKVLPLVLAAFGGMAVMVAPEIGTLTAEILLGLASALFAALAYVTIRRLSRTESPATIVLYFSLWSTVFGAAALAISALAGWTEVGLGHVLDVLGDTREVLLLCGIGFCGTFGQMLLTSAYSRERASVVSPFSYLAPVFSYILGFVVFGEVPTVEGMLGGALVITASIGVLLFSREPVHRSDLRLDGEA